MAQMKKDDSQELITIANISTSFGVHGEIKARICTDFPERFKETEEIYLVSPRGDSYKRKLLSSRFHKEHILLKIEGINSPEEVAAYRHWKICVPFDELMPLEEGEYWEFQLIGLKVIDQYGENRGHLKEILPFPGCDQYLVDDHGHELMVPAVEDFVKEINLEEGFIKMYLPED